jgi:hypothetical protein
MVMGPTKAPASGRDKVQKTENLMVDMRVGFFVRPFVSHKGDRYKLQNLMNWFEGM